MKIKPLPLIQTKLDIATSIVGRKIKKNPKVCSESLPIFIQIGEAIEITFSGRKNPVKYIAVSTFGEKEGTVDEIRFMASKSIPYKLIHLKIKKVLR